MTERLAVEIGKLRLANPVLTASGTFGQGTELEAFFDLNRLGGIVVKTITPRARPGNPPPRIHETAAGLLNSIGLPGPGIEAFISDELPPLAALDIPVIVNIAGENEGEFLDLAQRLEGVPGVAGLEANFSCPNVKDGGACFAQSTEVTERITQGIKERSTLPLIVKLTPNVGNVPEIARAAEAGGADAVSLVNTYLGTAIDWRTRRPVFANFVAGLSGPAIKPMALRLVFEVSRAVKIPVVGIGGISTAEDAIEFILAGATAIQVGTATFFDPMAAPKISERLPGLLDEMGADSVRSIIGGLVLEGDR
jgi:dihydroorotate dehydrogenase (NAD+) catalytic subunit